MKNLELVIDEKALEKIHAYARLVCEEKRSSKECYGFLLVPKEKNDGVVYDAALACNQLVTSVSGTVLPHNVKKTKREYNVLGYKAIGCWQSHGHGGVFHSGIDDNNLDNLILEAATNCLLGKERQEHIAFYPNQVYLYRKEGEDIILNFSSDYSYVGESVKKELESYPIIGFMLKRDSVDITIETNSTKVRLNSASEPLKGIVYSLVTNSKGDDYVEAGIVEWNPDNTIKKIYKEKGLEIKPVKVRNSEFSEAELRKEIREKVKNNSLLERLRL